MYCLKCGTQLADTAKFCHSCGTVVQRAAPPPPIPETRGDTEAGTSRGVPRGLLGCVAVLLGALLLVGLVLVFAYYLLGLNRSSGIAELAPDDAAAVVTFRPGALQLWQMRDTDRLAGAAAAFAPLVVVPGLPELAGELIAGYAPLLENVSIDPAKDIMPWIGRDMGLAVIDPNAGEYIFSVAVRDESRAGDFLAGLREELEDEGVEFDENDLDGMAVTEVVSGPGFFLMPLAYGVADGRLLVAPNREVLKDALDRAARGRDTLADNDAFRDALSAQPGNRLGAIYIDPDALGDADMVGALRWVGGSYALSGDGISFRYRLGFDRDRLDADQLDWLESDGIDNRLTNRIPDDTLLYMAGGSLAATLENAAAQSGDFGDTLGEIQGDPQLGGIYNLLEMMTGEFALAVSSDDEGLLALMSGEPFGVLIASRVEDGDDARNELDDIFTDIARETDSSYETDESRDGAIGYLKNEFVGSGGFLGYGVAGKEMILATSDTLVEEALAAKSTLGDNPRFSSTIGALPDNGLLYFYIDSDMIHQLVDILGVVPETSDDYTKRIKAIGIAVEPINRDGEMNTEMFFLTKRQDR